MADLMEHLQITASVQSEENIYSEGLNPQWIGTIYEFDVTKDQFDQIKHGKEFVLKGHESIVMRLLHVIYAPPMSIKGALPGFGTNYRIQCERINYD